MKSIEILLIGSGYMAGEYLKILKEFGCKVIIIGRSSAKVEILKKKYPEFRFEAGGIEQYLSSNRSLPPIAINTTNIEFLRITTEQLLNAGIKKILLEKPGDLSEKGLLMLDKLANEKKAQIYIAYNRRFYSSIMELKKQAELDGGILSAHFEFTEWIHTIDPALYEKETLKRWFISNSSHVIDTVFHLIGIPKAINCIVRGQNAISWHTSGSIFIGSGISDKGIPFTYHSNWQAPGRWSIEILTTKRRYYLKPMESLQIQKNGSVLIEPLIINDHLDKEFKPGLYLQTEAFLKGDYTKFITIPEQKEMIEFFYNKMSGY